MGSPKKNAVLFWGNNRSPRENPASSSITSPLRNISKGFVLSYCPRTKYGRDWRFAPTIPPLCLTRRAVYKPPRGGHRSHLTFALTHLAAARKAGIRFAMKCLARPPLHKGARVGRPICSRGGTVWGAPFTQRELSGKTSPPFIQRGLSADCPYNLFLLIGKSLSLNPRTIRGFSLQKNRAEGI